MSVPSLSQVPPEDVLSKRDGDRMMAIVNPSYGPPESLRFKEVERPTPKDDEVLVKVRAASVNAADWHLMRGKPALMRLMGFGLLAPSHKILGADMAGRIEVVGKETKRFHPGEDVFGDLSKCGFGAFAEYVSVPESALALKPGNISFEDAAAVPMAGVVALQGLRDRGHIHSGQRVLVNGASGGVGTFAVQIAKSFGAEVTAVCSTRNVERMRSLGADQVIDYSKEDFTKGGQQYDLILAANGYHSVSDYKRALAPKGVYVMTGGSSAQLFQSMILGPLNSMTGDKKMGNMMAKPNQKDLETMRDLLETGKITPVIDRRYPLSETAEAVRYLEQGHAQGKVVVAVPA
ncbi:MAG TPA: NAD(P)-dependent alcohol dehydrogenase [Nitrososphaerales archaeon]|nr:NAD(P)-dependent alcohol dehydrogenase [Nitrososphaerales archaeon]